DDRILYQKGTLTLTRFDLAKRIIAGRFESTLFRPDAPTCDTVRITDGRFDMELQP
ncbi:MAG: hypothetical protein H7Z75_02010, partial [Ferruginibacter sp.]|nr:hypothetical protein [Cytophagales bacterium]